MLKEDSDKNLAKIKNQGNPAKYIEKSSSQNEIVGQCIKVQESLDDDKKGFFYCTYYDDSRYWGRLLNVYIC